MPFTETLALPSTTLSVDILRHLAATDHLLHAGPARDVRISRTRRLRCVQRSSVRRVEASASDRETCAGSHAVQNFPAHLRAKLGRKRSVIVARISQLQRGKCVRRNVAMRALRSCRALSVASDSSSCTAWRRHGGCGWRRRDPLSSLKLPCSDIWRLAQHSSARSLPRCACSMCQGVGVLLRRLRSDNASPLCGGHDTTERTLLLGLQLWPDH